MNQTTQLNIIEKYKNSRSLGKEDNKGYGMPDFGTARRMILDRYTAQFGQPKDEVLTYAKKLSDGKCFCCGTQLYTKDLKRVGPAHFDHIKAASHFNLYVKGNAAILCDSCNTSKGNKSMREFYRIRKEKGLPVFLSDEELEAVLTSEEALYAKSYPKIHNFADLVEKGLVTEEQKRVFFYNEILSKISFFASEKVPIPWSDKPSDYHTDALFWKDMQNKLGSRYPQIINKFEKLFVGVRTPIRTYSHQELVDIFNQMIDVIKSETSATAGLAECISTILDEIDRPEVKNFLSIDFSSVGTEDDWASIIEQVSQYSSEVTVVRRLASQYNSLGRDYYKLTDKENAYIIDSVLYELEESWNDFSKAIRGVRKVLELTNREEIGQFTEFEIFPRHSYHVDSDFWNILNSKVSTDEQKATVNKLRDRFTLTETSIFNMPSYFIATTAISAIESASSRGPVITLLVKELDRIDVINELLQITNDTWVHSVHPYYNEWATIHSACGLTVNKSDLFAIANKLTHCPPSELTLGDFQDAIEEAIDEYNLEVKVVRRILNILKELNYLNHDDFILLIVQFDPSLYGIKARDLYGLVDESTEEILRLFMSGMKTETGSRFNSRNRISKSTIVYLFREDVSLTSDIVDDLISELNSLSTDVVYLQNLNKFAQLLNEKAPVK